MGKLIPVINLLKRSQVNYLSHFQINFNKNKKVIQKNHPARYKYLQKHD